MTTGKEKKVEQPPVVEPPEGTPPPEVQPTIPTQEQIDASVAEAEDRGYKKSQKVISKKDEELKALREQAGQFGQPSMSPTVAEGMLELLEAQQVELGERNPNIAKLKAQITVERQKEAQQQQWAQWQKVVSQQKEKLDRAVEAAQALGLNPDDEALEDVYEAFEDAAEFTGRFERAHKKLEKIAKKGKPKVESKETEEESEEEKERKILEKHGLLTSEAGGPSASSPSKTAATVKFAKGEITEEQARKAGVEFL